MSRSTLPARSILRHYRATDDDTRVAGTSWYPAALLVCEERAAIHGVRVDQAVCGLAHLSPRLPWAKNVEALGALLAGQAQPAWVLRRSWLLASSALTSADPWATFGRRASKTRSFAHAILGDTDSVTVDVWAARVAGIDPDTLRRPSGYTEAADAYRRAAKRAGQTPRDLQAICWVHIRGGAA